MKKLLISSMIVLFATCAVATGGVAAEKKALQDVDSDAFTSDTQVSLKGSGDDSVSIAWWIPNEFWEALFARDTTTSDNDKKAMLDSLADVSLLAIVQGDVTPMGALNFYPKEEIEKTMKLSVIDSRGKRHKIKPLKKINPDLEIVLGIFKPILGSAMGNLGNNMHFYVLNDNSKSTSRLLDPYEDGNLDIELTRRNKDRLRADIELPLDSLYIPRDCPNGKQAHVSWKYCPWSGDKLAD